MLGNKMTQLPVSIYTVEGLTFNYLLNAKWLLINNDY